MANFDFVKSNIEEVNELVMLHIENLANPMDSWLEDRLFESQIYTIKASESNIGYFGVIDDTLHFFYVADKSFHHAPAILEKIIVENNIKKVFVMTQDYLVTALIAEWDFYKRKVACFFTDIPREKKLDKKASYLFRTAKQSDVENIRLVSGDFFDERSGGYTCLEERVEAGNIFILEEDKNLLGCGIVEKSQFTKYISIGMFVNKDHRNKGVAKTILVNLKNWAYSNNFVPVAGCWYYNTVSRKSLESAGMAVTSIGFEVTLTGKEKLPLRTGNPPGELV